MRFVVLYGEKPEIKRDKQPDQIQRFITLYSFWSNWAS